MENGLFPAHLKFHGFCNMIKQDIDEPLAHAQMQQHPYGNVLYPRNWAVFAGYKATGGRNSRMLLILCSITISKTPGTAGTLSRGQSVLGEGVWF